VKKIISILIVVIMTLSMEVFASAELTLKVDFNVMNSAVNGTVSLSNKKTSVSVVVKVTNSNGDLNYFDQFYSDDEGKCTFSYINKGNSDDYTIVVRVPSLGFEQSKRFKQLSQDTVNSIYKVVNGEINSNSPDINIVRNTISSNLDGLKIDTALYQSLANPENTYAMLVNDSENKDKLENINDVISAFNAAIIMCALNERHSAAELVNIMNNPSYQQIFDMVNAMPLSDDGTKPVFDTLTNNIKNKVLEAMAKQTFRSRKQLKENLSFYTLAESITYAEYWTKVAPIMEKYAKKGLMNISYTNYNKLKKKDLVDKGMIGISYNSYEDIENQFNELVESQAVSENKKKNTGSSGGGSKTSVLVPAAPVVPKNSISQSNYTEENGVKKGKLLFLDMEEAKWAIEAVNALYEKGIVNGVSQNEFNPYGIITKAEVTKMFVSLLKMNITDANVDFSDLEKDSWSYGYIGAALAAGIVKGNDDNTFGGSEPINREKFAVMAKRVMDKINTNVKLNEAIPAFDDEASFEAWAKDSIVYLQQAKIMKSRVYNIFDSKAKMTRADVAVIIYAIISASI